MNRSNCPSRAELDSFQAGDLDDPRLASLSSHVEGCATCQWALETVIGDSVDPVLTALLSESAASPFADESACRKAIDRAAALSLVPASEAADTVAPAVANDHAGAHAAADNLPVEFIREYKLLAKLGEGGMGAVYQALHTRLDKVVALKILPADRMRDGGAVARFQREMKAVGRLDHPNIVRAMDAGEEGGMHFLVMEYVAGLDLSQLARKIGPLPIADACELVRQAALGLAEAHEHGMVHRDIKPSNLILAQAKNKRGQPTVKILDLGLALLSEALAPDHGGLTTTGQLMGTIDYMAPEQGGDSHQVDIRADIYSLGATLYHLLTGAAPFAGKKFDTPVKKLTALATQSPASVKARRAEIPSPLAAIVERMLAKNPAARFATPEELIEALKPYCTDSNLAALLDRASTPNQSPATPASEIGTHAGLSSPSGDTAPTIDRVVGNAVPGAATAGVAAEINRRGPAAKSGRKLPRTLAIAAAFGGAALAVLLGIVFFIQTPDGTVRIEIDDSKIQVVIDNDGKATFQGADKHTIVLKPGPHGVTITRDGFSFGTTNFELKKGEKPVLKIDFLAGKVQVTKDGTLLPSPAVATVSNSGWHGWPADAPPPAIAPFDAAQAKMHQEAWAKYLGVPVEWENSIDMKFRLIPPGEFTRGSPPEEIEEALRLTVNQEYWQACIKSEGPQHKVILTKPIYLGVHEVTQAEYERVLGTNPSFFAKTGSDKQWSDKVAGLDTASHPVEGVSWNDCAEFCAKLSANEKLQPFYSTSGETVTLLEGNGYRLPTEAQWEFACRAGTTTRHWSGDTDEALLRAAWFNANSGERTHTVGKLAANPFGLFDIQGNVWEWALDGWSAPYVGRFQDQPAINPSVPPAASSMRAFRGGIWYYSATCCRASFRHAHQPDHRAHGIGFRAALTLDAVRQAVRGKGGSSARLDQDDIEGTDFQRRAAAEIIRAGGQLDVQLGNQFLVIDAVDKLPREPHSISGVRFPTHVADDDLRALGGLTRLKTIVLASDLDRPGNPGVRLSDAGLAHLAAVPSLELVSLPGCPKITDAGLAHLAGLKKLMTLDLSQTGITGSGLARLKDCGQLSTLKLSGCPLTEGGLVQLPALAPLEVLATPLTDKSAPVVSRLPNLYKLEIHSELLTDAGLPALARLTRLETLTIDARQVTSAAVSRLSRQLPDCKIEAIHLAFRWPADAPPPAIAPFDAAQARQHQDAWAAYLGVLVEWQNSLDMKFRLVPPGEFTMGSSAEEIETALSDTSLDESWKKNIQSEAPQHKVVLTQPFYLSTVEVTQDQYQQVMGQNPSQFAPDSDTGRKLAGLDFKSLPVETVSWSEAAEFCAKLSQKERLKPRYVRNPDSAVTIIVGTGYRLPTEAQWEFACRAGTTTMFWTGGEPKSLPKIAWCGPHAGGIPHGVGSLEANPLGLHDMLGNVWEWAEDRWEADAYAPYKSMPAIDPVGPNAGVTAAGDTWRLVRGGSWGGPTLHSRAASRQSPYQNYKTGTIGFRVALPVETVTTAIAGPADKPAPP